MASNCANVNQVTNERFYHPVNQRWLESQKNDCSICGQNGSRIPLVSLLTEGTDHSQKICHLFHEKCIEGWSETCKNKKTEPNCPLCQRKIIVINPSRDQETLCAAQNGDFKTAFELLEYWDISKQVTNQVALLAIEKGALKEEQKPISKDNAGKVLRCAVRDNQLTILKICLEQFREEISREKIISAIREASKRGYAEIVKELIAFEKFEIMELSSSIILAAKGGHVETIMELLKDDNTPDHKGYIVFTALVSGQLELAQKFLNDPVSFKEIRGTACQVAAAENRTDILTQLLKGGEISESYLVGAFILTCRNGRLETLTELLHLGISAHNLCWGFTEAVSASCVKADKCLGVIKKLLQTGKISDKAIGEALVDHVYYTGGDTDVLRELLQTGKVLKEYLISAVEMATRFHSRQEIIDLLANGP